MSWCLRKIPVRGAMGFSRRKVGMNTRNRVLNERNRDPLAITETPEQRARREIDANLEAAGWLVQDLKELELTAGPGIAVREFPTKSGRVGGPHSVCGHAGWWPPSRRRGEAQRVLSRFSGVEAQTDKYAAGLPVCRSAGGSFGAALGGSIGTATRNTRTVRCAPQCRIDSLAAIEHTRQTVGAPNRSPAPLAQGAPEVGLCADNQTGPVSGA